MGRAAALLQLQGIDLELDSLRVRLEAIEAALGDSPAVREAQRGLLEAQARLHAARVTLQNLEFDSQSLNEKIAEAQERMYGGGITHPKQLQDLQLDIESLQRRRGMLEEQQFEALLAAEDAEARHAKLQHLLQQAEAEAAQSQGDLIAERDQVRGTIERLADQRDAVAASVPAADRELYERLRPAKRGRAVTRLEDGVCVSCGVAPSSSRVQAARQDAELVLCGNCGRILCAD